jgi:hypothetical protein
VRGRFRLLAERADHGLAFGPSLLQPFLDHHVADLFHVGFELRRRAMMIAVGLVLFHFSELEDPAASPRVCFQSSKVGIASGDSGSSTTGRAPGAADSFVDDSSHPRMSAAGHSPDRRITWLAGVGRPGFAVEVRPLARSSVARRLGLSVEASREAPACGTNMESGGAFGGLPAASSPRLASAVQREHSPSRGGRAAFCGTVTC